VPRCGQDAQPTDLPGVLSFRTMLCDIESLG
jgi:hypothetical protein